MEEPEPRGSPSANAGEIERLRTAKEQYEVRLLHGETLINEAREQGDEAKVARLERHWINLLHEYEQVCDRLSELESEHTPEGQTHL